MFIPQTLLWDELRATCPNVYDGRKELSALQFAGNMGVIMGCAMVRGRYPWKMLSYSGVVTGVRLIAAQRRIAGTIAAYRYKNRIKLTTIKII